MRGFPRSARRDVSGHRPPTGEGRVHSPSSVAVLFRAPALTACLLSSRALPCGGTSGRKRLPWDSQPSSRHRPAASTHVQGTQPRTSVRPRRSTRPRRFSPPLVSRVCCTPQPRPGFTLQGVVPHRGAVPGFPGRCPPAVRTRPPAVARSGLRALGSRALLPTASAVTSVGGEASGVPRPSWVSPPPGSRPRTVVTPSRPLRLRPSPQRARCGWSLAFHRCGCWRRGTTSPSRSRFVA